MSEDEKLALLILTVNNTVYFYNFELYKRKLIIAGPFLAH